MADFNITGEDKLLNYERFSPSFAVYKPLEADYSLDNQQSNIQIPTYQPQAYIPDLPKPELIDTDLRETEPVASRPKSAIELLKEAGKRLSENKPLYQGYKSSRALKDQLAAVESNGGNYKAFNPKGGGEGAVGKYQFRWNLWKDSIAKTTGIKDKNDFLNNPAAQEQFYDYYERTTLQPQLRQIKRQFPDTNYDDIQLMKLLHFQGLKGVQNFLSGGSNKPQSFNLSISDYLKRSS